VQTVALVGYIVLLVYELILFGRMVIGSKAFVLCDLVSWSKAHAIRGLHHNGNARD